MSLAALVVVMAGCSGDLPSASVIDKLRVLALRAEPPEIAPGETTALDLLAVDAPRATAPLSIAWLLCPAASMAVAAPSTCAGAQPLAGDGSHAAYTADAALLGGAASRELLVAAVVSDASDGAAGCLAGLDANGSPADPDHCVLAFKRLRVSARSAGAAPFNRNPALVDFALRDGDGGSMVLDGDGATFALAERPRALELALAITTASDAAERKPDGSFEVLDVSFFTTAGSLDPGRTLLAPPGCATPSACATAPPATDIATRWYPPDAAEASRTLDGDGAVRLWAVLRDDRGGVAWRAGRARPR